MSYRQIYIRKAEKLSLRHHSLIIKKESGRDCDSFGGYRISSFRR